MPESTLPLLAEATQLHLSALDEQEARAFISETAKKANLHFEPPVVEKMLELTGGHPHFLQGLCWELANQALVRGESTGW